MGTVKVTFTLDERTIARLNEAAGQLAKPKSEVVREAIQDFHDRLGRLSERERIRKLQLFDHWVPKIPFRAPEETDRELRELRRARRGGGRKSVGKTRR
jgi:ribbon-helix-helix CopG family protein